VNTPRHLHAVILREGMATLRIFNNEVASAGGQILQLEEVEGYLTQSDNVWLDILSPGEDEKEFLLDKMGFHPLAVEDCFSDPVVNAESFEDHKFIIARARDADSELDTEHFAVFLKDSLMVTVRHTKIPAIEAFRGRYRSHRLAKRLTKGPEFLLYELLDSVADDWMSMLEGYSQKLDEIEFQVFDPNKKYSNLLEPLHQIKQDLREMSKSIVPLHTMVDRMLRSDEEFLSDNNTLYFRDLRAVLNSLLTRINNYSAGATSTRDTYLSHISMQLSESNARLSEVMTTLTIIATIMLPLTLISGIFGMNVDAFGAGSGYFDLMDIIGAMLIFSFLMIGYFWRKGWFEKKES